MCTSPIYIDNPYKGLSRIGFNRYHDCTSLKIPVPCGNCPTCVRLRQSYLVQRCQMESISHHLFFITLTYSNRFIPKKSINGFELNYFNWKHLQDMFKRIRKNYDLPNLSYIAVSEYGGKRHRPHAHLILSYPDNGESYGDIINLERKLHHIFLTEWRVNLGSTRVPIYYPLCDYIVTPKGRTFDLHYINPRATAKGEEDVAFYVTKYVLKASDYVDKLKSALRLNLSPEKFEKNWRYFKPRCNISKGFGDWKNPLVKAHIRRGIEASVSNAEFTFPLFINPVTGTTFPLAPYYRRKFLTIREQEIFYQRNPDRDSLDDNFMFTDEYDPLKVRQDIASFNRMLDKVNARNNSDSLIHNNYDYEDSQFLQEALEVDFSSPRLFADDFGDNEDF